MPSLTLLITMITQELKKPHSGIVDRLLNYHRVQQFPKIAPLHLTWDKITYSRWIEGVKGKFRKGDIVTLKQIPVVDGHKPFQYVVEDIQELHWYAEVDTVTKSPKAMALRIIEEDGVVGDTVIWQSPDVIRHLVTTEKKHDLTTATKDDYPNPDDGDGGILRLAYLRE
jgi:hypothetical protein